MMNRENIPHDGIAYFRVTSVPLTRRITEAREERRAQALKRRKLIRQVIRAVLPKSARFNIERYWGYRPNDLLDLRSLTFSVKGNHSESDVETWQSALDSEYPRIGRKAQLELRREYFDKKAGRTMVRLGFNAGTKNLLQKQLRAFGATTEYPLTEESGQLVLRNPVVHPVGGRWYVAIPLSDEGPQPNLGKKFKRVLTSQFWRDVERHAHS